MEEIRKRHNLCKRELISAFCKPNNTVLDVGCGFGGDIPKWKHQQAIVTACDPNRDSIKEAKERCKKYGVTFEFHVGDITSTPVRRYDLVCYNFSLQYCFSSKSYFIRTMVSIKQRMKRGAFFVGCIPDSEFVMMNSNYSDKLGNRVFRHENTGYGNFGEKVNVYLADTPYYNNGAIPEPIAYKDELITWMESNGLKMIFWRPLWSKKTDSITDMYSMFAFQLIL